MEIVKKAWGFAMRVLHVIVVFNVSLILMCVVVCQNVWNAAASPFRWRTIYYMGVDGFMSLLPWHESDATRDVPAIIERRGYKVETHTCRTKDGYVLTLHRIPSAANPRVLERKRSFVRHASEFEETDPESSNNSYQQQKRPVVLLMHGLLQSSAAWVLNHDHECLPFLLADAGCDVFIGNFRGTSYSSSEHTHLHEDDPAYWDWSYTELGKYDVPAMVDYILGETGAEKLVYVGHSQATAANFVALSSIPSLNQKIGLFIAFAPAAFVSTGDRIILDLLMSCDSTLWYRVFGKRSFLRNWTPMQNLCEKVGSCVYTMLCLIAFYLAFGWTDHSFHPHRLSVLFSHTPDRSSCKSIVHFAQCMRSGGFHDFDYKKEGNLKRYGTTSPPHFDLSKISCPVALFWGTHDSLLNVEQLLKEMPPPVYIDENTNYSHMEYVWGKDTHEHVYRTCEELIFEYYDKDAIDSELLALGSLDSRFNFDSNADSNDTSKDNWNGSENQSSSSSSGSTGVIGAAIAAAEVKKAKAKRRKSKSKPKTKDKKFAEPDASSISASVESLGMFSKAAEGGK
eukprot:Nk52_evm49s2039 gene=Nk52_evmTU49s2039